MGVRVFRGDNWNRIKNGIISRKDIMHLDAQKDRELIRYLTAHAAEPCRRSIVRYAAEKYKMEELPEPRKNIDDLDDPYYEEYFVLQEQVVLEDNADVLREAAMNGSDYDMAAFAFCRLTGYSFPQSDCDAYSYRTFSCSMLPGTTAESITEVCQRMIDERGPLESVAKEFLLLYSDYTRERN